ncbi:FAD-binding oxidoreductase [candidate division KSB1 bacterium]|nr:FAD-binding oxidoreductase [candidate division KSB1 bacterium]
MLTRREFLHLLANSAAGFSLLPYGHRHLPEDDPGVLVNDIHAQLNPTHVHRVASIDSIAALRTALQKARTEGKAVSIAGGRHSMGGQQFGAGTVLIDTRAMNRVIALDQERGIVEVEAGIQWPALIEALIRRQQSQARPWGIIQKQTGADRLCLGGTLSSNIHGRGLKFRPIIADVESFTLMDSEGELRHCSRTENEELFRLAIGGYGLFGIITTVKLRLMPRTKLERIVELIEVDKLMPALEQRIAAGYLYGDCQFSIETSSDDFLKKGVFSCYRPLPEDTPMPAEQKELAESDWQGLYYLAHTDAKHAFERYASYYLSTHGQRYWSDTHQLGIYVDDYHKKVDESLSASAKATEMITEVYVPRSTLPQFMTTVREDFRKNEVQVIYGTIRLIERDSESFLAWAKEAYACIVMNLHIVHTGQGIDKSAEDFRRLIDRAIQFGGSYFLTYHRWASREQVQTCYPQMADFLRLKRKYDPSEFFQSDWYRHYRQMFELDK